MKYDRHSDIDNIVQWWYALCISSEINDIGSKTYGVTILSGYGEMKACTLKNFEGETSKTYSKTFITIQTLKKTKI